jgi:tRNA(fMet)-specific endonuclease VapC
VRNGGLLLDTSILIHLARGGPGERYLAARFPLTKPGGVFISAISVGELLAFGERNGWGGEKLARMRTLIEYLVVLDINTQAIVETYARLDVHLTRIGRRMGQQNDLWIAATAVATGAVLLTTDRDFDPLHPAELRREWVDPESLR